jgi:cephalosporin hydroxylase
MKVTIDTETAALITHGAEGDRSLPLYSRDSFEVLSNLWVKVGWNQKYVYTFSWMGRPIIQLPEDMIRMQEVIWQVRPTVIIETGVAHGGSLIYYASLLRLLGDKGRVVGVDIEIKPHNRAAIEAHEMAPLITLIEGDSTADAVLAEVAKHVSSDDTVLVVLDSDHSKTHVLRELEAYNRFVTPGSYIVATDGVMMWLSDVPRGRTEWRDDNPEAAAREFVGLNDGFVLEQPEWPFNESELGTNVTHWPGAWLRRV